MSGFDERYQAVRDELAATPGKRVLLVEGEGDVDFLTFLLDKPPLRERNAHAGWVFGPAGGKASVLRMLEREPGWTGLVDRDAWSEREIDEAVRKTPNLLLLPRYCIENYLIDPEALDALSVAQEEPANRTRLDEAADAARAQWPQGIRHGSLWRAVQPLHLALQALGFNATLLRFPLPDDGGVREVLGGWSELLSAERIFADYRGFQARGEAMPPEQALRLWVHGKVFWRHAVVPALEDALNEEGESRLRRLVMRRMPLPEDIRALLEKLFEAEG
jgi:hypothetical protein